MPSDEDLMRACADGDDAALGELYRRHRAALLAALARRCASRADAEDIVQQTFLRAHAARATYRRGEPVRPWLLAIARNLRKDALRAASRRPEPRGEPDLVPSPACTLRAVEQRETVTMVRAAVRRLAPTLRSTVELHWLEDRDFEEVARITRVRQGTLRVRAHRACVALRAILLRLESA